RRVLQARLQGEQAGRDSTRVLVEPAVVEPANRDGIEEVMLLPADPTGGHEAGGLEDAQVLHRTESGHLRQRLLELRERLAIALMESIEQESPGWIRQRPE